MRAADDAARAAFAKRALMAFARRTRPADELAAYLECIRRTVPDAMGAAALACLLDDMAWRSALLHVSFVEMLQSCL